MSSLSLSQRTTVDQSRWARGRQLKAGSQNDARPCVALRRHALSLAATQPNAKIDLNPIPAFPRVAFERQIEKNCGIAILLPLAKFNATQRKAFVSICGLYCLITSVWLQIYFLKIFKTSSPFFSLLRRL